MFPISSDHAFFVIEIFSGVMGFIVMAILLSLQNFPKKISLIVGDIAMMLLIHVT